MTTGRIRLEHLPADIQGLLPIERAAISGRLSNRSVFPKLEDIALPRDPYLTAERAHLSKWLEAQVTTLSPHVAVLDSIRAIAQPNTSCVVCNIEPRLLGGPTTYLWQVLHAIRLAQVLSQRFETRVIPLLWIQADGRDSAEFELAQVLNRHFELQSVRLRPVARGASSIPDVVLEHERHGLGAVRALLAQLYGDYEFIENALDLFVPREGETLPRASSRLMYELFGKHGLVVVESARLREETSHAMAKVIGAGFLEATGQALESLPTDSAFDLETEDLVYHQHTAGLRVLTAGGDGYRYTDEPGSRTRSELAAEIVQDPLAWSPGPLMRSLVRDLVLPVVAAVGDGRELVRHLSLTGLHTRLDRDLPAFFPRVRVTLIDEDARSALKQLDLALPDVLRRGLPNRSDPEASAKDNLALELDSIAAEARARLADLKERVAALDPRLVSQLKATSRELQKLLSTLGQKMSRVDANQSGKRTRQERCLDQGLRPLGRAQDEVFGPFCWVARHGTEWIDQLLEELDPLASEHLAVQLG